MAKTSMSAVFRALLARGGVIVKPGAHNALSARIIEAAGFESIGVSGYAVSATLLGKPDCGLVTLDEMVMMSRYIAGAVNIPAIADADTGYGNAINVTRTVEDFIRAGVAQTLRSCGGQADYPDRGSSRKVSRGGQGARRA